MVHGHACASVRAPTDPELIKLAMLVQRFPTALHVEEPTEVALDEVVPGRHRTLGRYAVFACVERREECPAVRRAAPPVERVSAANLHPHPRYPRPGCTRSQSGAREPRSCRAAREQRAACHEQEAWQEHRTRREPASERAQTNDDEALLEQTPFFRPWYESSTRPRPFFSAIFGSCRRSFACIFILYKQADEVEEMPVVHVCPGDVGGREARTWQTREVRGPRVGAQVNERFLFFAACLSK